MIKRSPIFLFLFLISCSSSGSFLDQDHSFISIDKETGFSNSLSIKANGTFYYEFNGEFMHRESSGTWKREGKSILLNSFPEFKTGYVRGLESSTNEKSGINVLDETGTPISTAFITFGQNKNYGVNTDNEGFAEVSDFNFDSIVVHFLGDEYEYTLNDTTSNYLELKISLIDISKTYFKDEAFSLDRNKVIDKSGNVYELQNRE